jgi:competence ComEA-like helix-hairpin-helix protein
VIPRLVEEEAHRVLALAIVVVALLAVPLLARACAEPARAPFPICSSGAVRTHDGRVSCAEAEGEGEILSAKEALLAGTKIDVNRANAEDLEIVPGIGPKLAERILADRIARGSFRSIDDLARVAGIGEKTVERMRPYLRIHPPMDAAGSTCDGFCR